MLIPDVTFISLNGSADDSTIHIKGVGIPHGSDYIQERKEVKRICVGDCTFAEHKNDGVFCGQGKGVGCFKAVILRLYAN